MAETVFVHIGLHKTGSTAIQKFLTANARRLRRNGILYPRTGQVRIAHHQIAWSMRNNARVPWADLRAELAESDTAVLSSEEFESVRSPEAWERLRDNLPGDVKIVCYLRRQDELLESHYNQHRKTGGLDSPAAFKRRVLYQMDYLARLQPFADAFGVENIIVRPYDKTRMPNGLFADFLSAIGRDMKADYVCPSHALNPSLNDTGIALMRFVRTHLPNRAALWCARQVAERFLCCRPGEPPRSAFSPEERRDLLSRFAESNAEVARRYLGRSDGVLF